MADDRKKVVVVVPTYNEAENIVPLLEGVLALPLPIRVLVMDDRSPDGTAERAEKLGDSRVVAVRRTGTRGYGCAVLEGFRRALSEGADLIVGMDADISHDPAVIPRLVERSRHADIVIGSRYCPDGGTINWPVHRIALSRTANQYVKFILGLPSADSTSGFRCYRREIVEKLDLDEIRSEGYSFLVELLYRSWLAGAKIDEVPILFRDRLYGKSKISSIEIYRSIFMVLRLKLSLHRK